MTIYNSTPETSKLIRKKFWTDTYRALKENEYFIQREVLPETKPEGTIPDETIPDGDETNKPTEESWWQHDYSGCYFTVRIKVDREISLTALEFLGPAAKNITADYMVNVIIQQQTENTPKSDYFLCCCFPWTSYSSIEELLPAYTTRIRKVKTEQKFIVELPTPVKIKACKWIDIKFELIGPKTQRMSKVFWNNRIVLNDMTELKVELSIGSGQLSRIYFTMD